MIVETNCPIAVSKPLNMYFSSLSDVLRTFLQRSNSKDYKSFYYKDTCTRMFTAALFTIAKTWNQPKCPSMTDWMRKMWHIYTMEYYAAIKNDEFVSFVGT